MPNDNLPKILIPAVKEIKLAKSIVAASSLLLSCSLSDEHVNSE